MAEVSSGDILPYMFLPEYESNESGHDNGESSDSDVPQDDPVHGRAVQPVSDWCGCTKCIHMPKDKDCICC